MSWYFLGGFSAYWIVPSGRCRNHSGCSRHPRMVGRALEGDVERDLDAELARRARRARRSRRACRAPGGRRCGRPRRRRSPTGCPDRPGSRAERVVAAPCGASCRSGGSAAGRATSKPMPATYGEPRRSTSRKRAVAAGLGRRASAGTARTRRRSARARRSTSTAQRARRASARRARSGWRAIAARQRRRRGAAPRAARGRRLPASAAACSASRVAVRAACARGRGRAPARRPRAARSSTSCPASTFARARGARSRTRSTQPRRCTRSGRASRRRTRAASGRCRARAIGTSCHVRLARVPAIAQRAPRAGRGRRRRSSASTSTASPDDALDRRTARRRPPASRPR